MLVLLLYVKEDSRLGQNNAQPEKITHLCDFSWESSEIVFTCGFICKRFYTIIDLCWGRHGVLLNSKRHIDRRGAEVNMIK